MPDRLSETLRLKWEKIPEDTEVLITHGPPHGILDTTFHYSSDDLGHCGCELLRARIEHLPKLRLHAFGHIHEGHGREDLVLDNNNRVRFVNAAICTRSYNPYNKPQVEEL
jgi:Icc-related predicted phosphoesterase